MNPCIPHQKKEWCQNKCFHLNGTCPKNQMLPSKSQWPLCFAFSYVQPVTKCYRQKKTVEEVPLQQASHHENTMICAPQYQLLPRNAATITLRFQLFSARYTALQMKNSVTVVFAIDLVTIEKMDDSRLQMYCREAMHCTTANRHLELSAKRNGTQRRTKVSP